MPIRPANPLSEGGDVRVRPHSSWIQRLPGILLSAVLATLASVLGQMPWMQSHGFSALTVAIVLGMVVGNTVYPRIASASAAGVLFSKQTLLRVGIILYGLRLTFRDIAHVGMGGVTIDSLVLISTFSLSWWAGPRFFGLDRKMAMLVGAGSSICGAAAVMAAAPVVGARAEQVTVAVSTVVVFGTIAMFLYPSLYHLNAHYHLLAATPTSYGIFAGSTIHEVAQVVAAGRAITDSAANTAVITKMVRVMMLAPFLIGLSVWSTRSPEGMTSLPPSVVRPWPRIVIPWFALGFIAVAGLNSFARLPHALINWAVSLDTYVLGMAMAALGISTYASAIRTAGLMPLALGALLFVWLLTGGFAINYIILTAII